MMSLSDDKQADIGLKSLLRQGHSKPEFYGDLVYELMKIVGSHNFLAQFIKMISNYKKIGNNINVLQQTACLVVNPITVGNFSFLFNCTPVGRTSDFCLLLWLLSGPPRFTFWNSFAPLLIFMYCWVLVFALSPFYILIYMF